MLTEEGIVTSNNTRLTVTQRSSGFPCVDFPALGVRKGPKVRVDLVNFFPVDTASPNKAAVTQI